MRRRILLADDSVTIQKVIELTFMDEDYDVKAVSNGDEAIQSLSEYGPDFVIADVHMPGANGYEVCRRSKEMRPAVPVLLLVGTFEPFDEAQARAAGAESHLKKPFDSQELLQRVGDLLASRPSANAVPPPETVRMSDLPSMSGLNLTPEPELAPLSPPVEEWRGFELEPDPEPAPTAYTPSFSTPSPFEDEQAFALEEPSADWKSAGSTAYAADNEPMFEMDAAPEPVTPPPSVDDVFGFEAPFPAEPEPAPAATAGIDPFASLSPMENQLTDTERLGVPETSAPLVGSLEETERRIEAPAPHSLDEAHEPQAPARMAAPPPAMPDMPATPSLTQTPYVGSAGNGALSDADVDRIARRVIELLGDKVVRDLAWEVVPDLAEVVIRDRLRELESQADILE